MAIINKKQQVTRNLVSSAVLLVFIGLGGGYYWVLPQLQTAKQAYNTNWAKNEGLKADIAELQQDRTQLDQAKLGLQQKGVDLSLLSQTLPADEDLPSIYVQLQAILNQSSGLSTTSFQVGVPTASPLGGAKVPVTVSATGSYADLKSLLSALEHNIRPVSLSSVAITSASSKAAGAFQMSVVGSIYAQALSSSFTATVTK